jgi:hypothetical protein
MPSCVPKALPRESLTCRCGYVQVMAKYNVVFQYLLRLKRIQIDLESSWAVMRRQAGRSRDLPLHTRRLPLWHLRHHMAYIIANLQIYVQVRLLCFAVCRRREHLLLRVHVLSQDLSNACKLPHCQHLICLAAMVTVLHVSIHWTVSNFFFYTYDFWQLF